MAATKGSKKALSSRRPHLLMESRSDLPSARSLTQSTFTRSWSKSTPILVFHQKPWWSWTLLFLTSLSVLLVRHQNWQNTTRDQPSHPVRSRLLSVFFSLVSWPSTPSLRVPRPSTSTLHLSKLVRHTNRPFSGPPKYNYCFFIKIWKFQTCSKVETKMHKK